MCTLRGREGGKEAGLEKGRKKGGKGGREGGREGEHVPIPRMRPVHVLVELANRDVKVQVEGEDDAGEEDHKDSEGSVLEVSQLDLHRSVRGGGREGGKEGRREGGVPVIRTISGRK